jgi:hypothetical protein
MQLAATTRPGPCALTPPEAAAVSRWGRGLEFLAIFVAVPVVLRWWPLPVPRLLVLAAVTAGGLALLLRDPTFDWHQLVSMKGLQAALPGIALRALLVATTVAALVEFLPPDAAPASGEARAVPWLLALGLYPFLSAWPQEVLYRVFFFHRYGALVGPKVLLAANAAAFGALHLVYPNLVAPLLTVPAGLLLALTYRRTRAMGPVWVEHALYGLALFGLGLGGYFGAGPA